MKFSIRDMIWFTLVVGLLLGWGLDHFRLSWQNATLIREANKYESLSLELADTLEMKHPLAKIQIVVDGTSLEVSARGEGGSREGGRQWGNRRRLSP